MKKTLRMKFMLLLFALVVGIGNVWADDTYVRVTSTSDLVVNGEYVISDGTYLVTGYDSKLASTTSGFSINGNTMTVTTAEPLIFTLGGSSGAYTLAFADGNNTKYLGGSTSSGGKTNFVSSTSATYNNYKWAIAYYTSESVYAASTTGYNSSTRYIANNNGTIGFYTSTYSKMTFYKKQSTNPTITVNATDLKPFAFATDEGPSMHQTITVSGSNLTNNISLSVGNDSPFEISTSANTGWTNSLSLTLSNGSVSPTPIYIRMKNFGTNDDKDGTLNLQSSPATAVNVSLSGHVVTPLTVAQARTAIDEAGDDPVENVYVKGIVSEIITAYNSTYGNISYNISTDGQTTSDQLQSYRGKSYYGKWFTSANDVKVGDIVVIYGNLKKHNDIYEFDQDNYLVTLKRTYTVTYEGNGNTSGSVPAASSYLDGTTVTVSGNTGSLVKTNYIFNGWNTEQDGNGYHYSADDTFTITENTTLYAEWTPQSYSYSINITDYDVPAEEHATAKLQVYNGSSYVDAGETIAHGSQVKVVVTPDDGYSYTLAAVYGISTPIVIDENNVFTMPTGSVNVTVTTRRLYTITYPDSYSNGSVSEIASAYAGANITIETTPATYYYLSSMTATYGSGTEVEYTKDGNNIKFEMPAADVYISAIAFERDTYTVTYSVNGATNIIEPAPVDAGNNIATLPTPNSGIPEGFTFDGWTKGDALSKLESPFTPTENVTLHAIFKRSETEKIPAYVYVNEGLSDYTGEYLIVYNNTYALDSHYGNTGTNTYATYVDISSHYSSNVIEYNNTTSALRITAKATDNGYSLYDEGTSDGAFLGNNSSATGSKLRWDNSFTKKQNEWTLGVNSIVSVYDKDYAIRWNNNSNSYRFAIYGTDGQQAVQLFRKQLVDQTVTKYYTLVLESDLIATADMTINTPILIKTGKKLDMDGNSLICNNAANIIVEDGAQLITTSENVKATFKKDINAATVDSDYNWYLISSPIGTVTTASITTLLGAGDHKYNLYKFNEATGAWNGNGSATNHFESLTRGNGYLYRNNDGADLTFAGTVVTGTPSVDLTFNETNLAGFNLLGNPYPHNITSDYLSLSDDAKFSGCYTLKDDGTWTSGLTTSIKPGEGFFVQVNKATTVTFNQTAQRGNRYNQDYIQFSIADGQYEDVTFALFDKGIGLDKINHRNAEVPMIYINQNGQDYAIATMSDDVKSFSLNFKAMKMGQYTLSYKAKGEYNYLHVIDRLTGADIDMLLDGEYSFIASPTDSDNRFIVRLAYLPDYGEGNDEIFAFQSGSDIYVSGEGDLQVFDVLGRFVMSEHINGATSISADALSKGVYVLRIVGSEIKTQKIVVR